MADDLEIGIGINPAGAQSGARQVKAAVGDIVQDATQMGAAFKRLKASIDPAFGATEKFNKAMAEYNQLLKEGKIDQASYAKQTDLIKRAFDAQIASLERNSVAAKQAAADKKAILLKETQDREQSAREAKQIADQWLAKERANTQGIKAELEARLIAEKREINEAVLAAKAGAAAQAAARREGGVNLTKAGETAMIREAAAATKIALRERLAAEHETNAEIKADYERTYNAAKLLAQEAAHSVVASVHEREAAERAVIESLGAVDKAERQESIRAAREAAAAAVLSAKERESAEVRATAATKAETRATEDAARAAKRQADAVAELRASINPAMAAQQRYNNTMKLATQALLENSLKEGEWIQIQKQAKIQMDINTRSLGRMNQVGIQLGYQMQDVTASIASGINPLVIFAHQSGQVAYAMQGMGGAAGKFAGILGGIWFQAVLGAVTVLAMLWKSEDEGKKKTEDLMDAEWRRTATLKELTKALDDYVKKQKESNNTTQETSRLAAQTMANVRATKQLELQRAKRDLYMLEGSGPQSQDILARPDFIMAREIEKARQKVRDLQDTFNDARDAEIEARAAYAQSVGKNTAMDIKEDAELQKAYENYLTRAKTKGLTDQQQNQIQKNYSDEVRSIAEKYNSLKEQESKLHRENTKAIRDEMAAYAMPVEGPVTSGYGSRKAPLKPDGTHGSVNHMGMDIGVPIGTPVKAPQVATVETIGYSLEMGKYVILSHGAGVTTRYLHLSDTSQISKGQHLDQGEEFAKSGNTGGVRPHLHYEVRINGKPVDPSKGIFPIDTLKAEAAGMKDIETAAHKAMIAKQQAAQDSVAKVSLQEEVIDQDDTKSNEEKLTAIAKLEDQKVAIITAAYGEQSKEAENAKRHELEVIDKYNQLILKNETNRIHQQQQIEQIHQRGKEEGESSKLESKSSGVDFLANNGLINDRQAIAMRAALYEEEYAMLQRHEEQEYNAKVKWAEEELKLPNQDKEKRESLMRELEIAKETHLAKMYSLELTHSKRVEQLQQQSVAVSLAKYRDMATAITGSLRQSLQGFWTHSLSFKQAMINLADSIVYKFMDMGIQLLQNWIMTQIKMLFFKKRMDALNVASSMGVMVSEKGIEAVKTSVAVAAQAIKTSAVVAGAATSTAVTAVSGKKDIISSAAQAAAGAYKALAGIPVVGPFLAPAAAAAALFAVMRFTGMISAEGGMGEVPSDQMAMVHKKEMILPAWIAEPMRQSLKGGGASAQMFGATAVAGGSARSDVSGGGDRYDFHYQPRHHNMGADLDSLLRQDGQSLRKWLKNEMRNGSLKVKK